MQPYANTNGQSNVKSYGLGDEYIVVEFMSGRETEYTYSYSSAGRRAVEEMKKLAEYGSGLNSHIGRNKPKYSHKR